MKQKRGEEKKESLNRLGSREEWHWKNAGCLPCLCELKCKGHQFENLMILVCKLALSSVQFSCSVMSNSLRPHGLQHARPPCPSPTPRVCSISCPSSWWCHPTILSFVVPFSSHLQSLPASRSFPVSQFFVSDGQGIGASASASVLPMSIQDWFPLGWTGLISLQSKGL